MRPSIGDERAGGMKKRESNTRKRGRALPLALIGLFLGAGLAYALEQWRRALMPEPQLRPGPEGVSFYEVNGDVTKDWPAGAGEGMGTDAAAQEADDLGEEVWGDVPAAAALFGAGAGDAGDDDALGEPGLTRRSHLEDIEGIGPVYAKTLAGLGLLTTDDVLRACADPKGRQGLAEATGISEKLILRWVNQADLFRIKGVGEQYADLLEAAGVDTVPELAQRRADNLAKKMVEVNEQKKRVRRPPAESQVAAWIEQAKSLPRVVTY
jgi:predicted flap endonuclease-1-like 5' DNA nuclease